ncbi:MAG: hypothetical protein QOD93_1564 [Acetobacteraceae bacterium]|jgi:hypothetical protein|nr:hypothetical protein [Acetobacteraceae bacterium]MEA2768602.1 hypothetical protein [Acetobacteraceae bacterium]
MRPVSAATGSGREPTLLGSRLTAGVGRKRNGRFALHNVEKQTFGDRWSIGCFSPTKIRDLKKWNLSICRQENNLVGPEPASFSPIEL